ncbi:MAG: LytTR family transcriptional regulator [Dorea sp.]|nr:LytTR family transcriptional regulator [Dorea sp.]
MIHEEEIIYVEAGDKYSGIRTSEGFYRVKYTITEMKQQLDPLDFYMPHRSYIVNMNYIDKIEEEKIYLINREKIKISRLKRKDFRTKFFDFIRRKSVYGN